MITRAAALIVGLCISGCVPAVPDNSPAPVQPPVTQYSLPYSQIALEFRLTDGTRCVTTYDGGVDCDWRH